MVIVEGCELTGRSEFARKLSIHLGYPLHRRPINLEHRYYGYLNLIKPRIVYDGFHMRDIIEGKTTWSYYTSLDRMLLTRATVIVVLTADEETIKLRCKRPSALAGALKENDIYLQCVAGCYKEYSPYVHLRHHAIEEQDFPGVELFKEIERSIQTLAGVAAFLKSTEEVR